MSLFSFPGPTQASRVAATGKLRLLLAPAPRGRGSKAQARRDHSLAMCLLTSGTSTTVCVEAQGLLRVGRPTGRSPGWSWTDQALSPAPSRPPGFLQIPNAQKGRLRETHGAAGLPRPGFLRPPHPTPVLLSRQRTQAFCPGSLGDKPHSKVP